MNTARKGRAHEHEVIHLLKAHGYSVIRGAGSKGEVLGRKTDICATKYTDQSRKEIWLVILQCKVGKR